MRGFLSTLNTWWLDATDRIQNRAPKGAKRSPKWAAVRDAHLKKHPRCACCGGTKKLRVHHLEPFHVSPAKELDPDNLLTLCEAGKYGINCHLLVGHLGNWRRWNPLAVFDARRWNVKLLGKITKVTRELTRTTLGRRDS